MLILLWVFFIIFNETLQVSVFTSLIKCLRPKAGAPFLSEENRLIILRNALLLASHRRSDVHSMASRKFVGLVPRLAETCARRLKRSRDSRYLTYVWDGVSTVSIITSRYTVDVAGTSGNRARLYVNYTEFIGVCVYVYVPRIRRVLGKSNLQGAVDPSTLAAGVRYINQITFDRQYNTALTVAASNLLR